LALPTLGQLAPDFTLLDHTGTPVTLSDYRDRSQVVLFFYPKAMTPGCTVQARGMRDVQAELESLGAVALGVSIDPVARLQRFVDRDELNFPLLSDEDHAVAEQYGVWGLKKFAGREFMGLIRTTFLIGRDGRLLHVVDKVRTKTHHEVVLDWLKQQAGKD